MKTLKHFYPFVLLFMLLGFTQCEVTSIVDQSINSKAIYFDIPPMEAGDYILNEDITLNFDSLISEFEFGMINITSVTPRSATLYIIDDANSPATFDIIDNVEIGMESSAIPSRKIAWKNPVPQTGLITLSMDVNKTNNVLDFANANTVTVNLKAKVNAALTHPVQMKAIIKYRIIAEL